MDYRRTFRSAAVAYVDLVSRIPAERWDAPALGDWTLRDLVGHTASSALRQVPDVLSRTAPAGPGPCEPSRGPGIGDGTAVAVGSAEGFWAYARGVPAEIMETLVAASTADARETGRLLGDDPAGALGELAGRATQALAAAADDDVVATPVGGMRVRDWLPTRTFELVVHGMDTAAAAGVPHGLAPEAVTEAAVLAARVAAATGDGEPLLRALTGRGELPPAFSVV